MAYCGRMTTAETIQVAAVATELGLALIAVSDAGICALELGDDELPLRAQLARRFPGATIVHADADAESRARAAITSPTVPPLDLRGTAFQTRVWAALRELPAGATVTYRALADRIGAPHAVRAVAGACAANPVAVLVPCHRVVRSDGGLGGYRWGLERKRALLARERAGEPATLAA